MVTTMILWYLDSIMILVYAFAILCGIIYACGLAVTWYGAGDETSEYLS